MVDPITLPPQMSEEEFPSLDLDFLNTQSFINDLVFDTDFDFSLEDLDFTTDDSNFITVDNNNNDCLIVPPCSGDGSSGPVSLGDSGGGKSIVNGFLNSPSPESGVVLGSGSSSPSSSNGVVGDVDVDDKKGGVFKRKKDKEEEEEENCNESDDSRCSKFRKSENSDNVKPEEDKKKARLMRNRESAQLSRQRKKHYVEELEDKVRSMHSVITDLNNKISYIMAENVTLRQQLCGGNVVPQQGVVYPPPPTMGQMPYPWIPCASYPMKPQGSQVPLVPIPRLKPRQPIAAAKPKKSDSKKNVGKTKKVSSVTFLGFLFFVLLFWGLVPLVNVRYGGKVDMSSSGFGYSSQGFNGRPQERVLTIDKHLNGSHPSVEIGSHTGKTDLRECGGNRMNCRRVWVEGAESNGKQGKHGSDGVEHSGNSSEPLVASLYVPRNDKLVKIDGNLIIHSVLASEKAKATVTSTNEAPQTSLAIAGDLATALSVSNGGRQAERHPHMYRSSTERQKALNSCSRDGCKENPRSSAADGSLQKWFREGLAGPILSSGMCTEVFQFDVSSSANPGAIVPATPAVNVSAKNASESVYLSKRNRRILNRLPDPLAESHLNSTEKHARMPSQNGAFHNNKSVSSMVVSVLVDPREGGDREVDGGISSKSLSRIFVVVLIDSVKYVTYSCMLPFKGSTSQLVTT
ncbi:hypothetical protein IFM89_008402 [Coptis chinensis]|uniref:BZIP domain-containing protein n=1 Tax=Coptis chinensis TaxID=261450 RepID=A0A835HD29_9MAGN|nr:hypothetical protein IFM89_008402 [Coptis chinensis]